MAALSGIFDESEKGITKAFKKFSENIYDNIKYLDATHEKHERNAGMYHNGLSKCITEYFTNVHNDASHNLDEMVKFIFLLKYARGMI